MKTITFTLISCSVGLLAGWGSASLFKNGEVRPEMTGEASMSSAGMMKAAPRRDAVASLDSVQSCKDIIQASGIDDGRHPLLRRFEYERALRRWIELDPEGALAEAETRSSPAFTADLFKAWVELDPKAALAALRRSNRTLTSQVAREFFVTLMARDPALAAAELKEAPWKGGKTELLGWNFHAEVARAWMRSDPQAAIASLGPAGSLENPDEGQRTILAEWAKTDFAAAWKHVVDESKGEHRLNEAHADQILAAGLLAGSKEALAVLESLPLSIKSDFGRDFTINPRGDTARTMVEGDTAAAIKWAESRPEDDPLGREVLMHAARKLASSDPMKALELMKDSANAGETWEQDGVFRESFASLAAADPAKAVEMIGGLEAGRRKDAMSGYLTRMFAVDVEGSIEQCRAWLADPEMKAAFPEAFAEAFSWGHGAGIRDPGPVLEALPELNDAVDSYVIATWAKCDPEASAAWMADRLAEGKKLKGMDDKGVLSELAISEPEFTAKWVSQLPEPKFQATAARALTANWGAFNPQAAAEWIESLPAGEVRDAAVAGMEIARTGVSKSFGDPFAGPDD